MAPLPYRHLTSVLLRRDGDLFLFDCGEGTQVALRKLNLSWKKISAIFISHTHADHVTGLPGLLMLSSQVDREEPLYIYGPPKIAEYIEYSRRVLDMYINYEIIVKELPTDTATDIFTGGGVSMRAFPLRHTKPCLGYSMTEESRPGEFHPEKALALGIPQGPLWGQLQKSGSVTMDDGRVISSQDVMGAARSGRKFTFVTDTLAFPTIAEEAAGSDLFVCEGMFESALLDTALEKRHMTAEQAAHLAEMAKVKKLALIHYSPRYNDYELKTLLKEARAVFPDTVLSRDGAAHEILYVD
jgi:ribonuclease Z